ncbi:MAG: T9SS type B sorting domain-containing protein [Weeksellaceae bacterium]|nr:T9SS type B sorting domain-containing protein [Bacteroidota bacterium]MCG2781501.1 T9SS type B sorting domain-containing protein [Weeksellaceae bacterium]
MRKFYILFVFLTSFWQSFYEAQVCPSLTVTDNSGNSSVLVDCNYPLVNGQCLSLNATAPDTRGTSSYSVAAANFTPYVPFNSGTALNANYDDLYAEVIDIPFTFCFFGKYYNKLVIGSNGLITFDLSQLGKISYPNIGQSNPDPLLPLNSIFGVYQDLVFSGSDQSEIYYSVIGTGSCRKLVINFYEGRIAGCNDRSSSQIVLSEFTNEIEIFVDHKTLPCTTARFPNALLGIMNGDGTLGYSPTNRNTGVWQANKEAWKFSPDGPVISPVIQWFNSSNTLLGTGKSISVCPQENTQYHAKATYNVCGSPLVFTDSIDVNFAPDFPLAKNYTKIFCVTSGTSENIDMDNYRQSLTPQNPANLNFTYYNSRPDAQTATNGVGNNVTLSNDKTFYVRIQNPSDPTCYRIAELKFQFISNVLLGTVVTLCDANNDGIENNYQLSAFNNQLFAPGSSGTVTYYSSAVDAQNSTNPVTTANITSQTQLWVSFATAACSQVFGPVSVAFTPGPSVNSPINFPVNTCDINDDKKELFDFPANLNSLVSSEPGVTFSYFATFQEAYTGFGAPLTEIHEGKYSIFVRVAYPGGCFSVAEVKMDVNFFRVEANTKTAYICFDGVQDISVDLAALSQSMLISPTSGVTVTFHLSQNDAELPANAVSSTQLITDDGNSVNKIFYVRFEDVNKCYTVRPLTVSLIHPVAMQNNFDVCDIGNNGTENINLAQFSSSIAGIQPATVTYYNTLPEAQNGNNPVSNVTLTGTLQLYAKVQVQSCTEIYPVTVNLVSTPLVKTVHNVTVNNICDNNNDGLEIYDLTQHRNQIYTDLQPVQFTYYTTYNVANQTLSGQINNPAAYVASADNTIFVKVQFASGACSSVSTLKIKLTFLPALVLSDATLRKCDPQFNFNESFNLNDAVALMFDQTQNSVLLSDVKVTYYNTLQEANAGLSSTQINPIQNTFNALTTVFARFQSNITGCYSVKAIHLKTYFPPKAINSVISGICDSNLDGKYEVNLPNYTSQMVDIANPDNSFKFYLSQSDAQNNINAISDPANFEIAALPARIWVKVENIPGCNDKAFIDLQAGTKVSLANSGPYLLEPCDDGNDGKEIIDLTNFETQIFPGGSFEYYPTLTDLNKGTNQILNPNSFNFDASVHTNGIFVKVNSSGLCPAGTVINVKLKKTPVFAIADHYFCPYDDSVDIKPDFTGLNLVAYEWKNPAGEIVSVIHELLGVNVTGIYSLKVTAANGCPFTTTFNVKHYEVPVITQLVANENTYTVIATGSKPILYSMDGQIWQTSNVFPNLPKGVFTFYVKFLGEECLGLPKKGVMLDIPNAFTPNADGINDTWEVDGLDVFDGEKSIIQVFNRQQTLVFEQLSSDKFIWNGKWLSRPVPTATYWYIITLPDGRIFNGWVVVKNRN